MHQGSIARITTLSTLLLAGAVGGQARASVSPYTDEPITIGIAIGLGTGIAVTLAYDQATANFLSTAVAFAKPQPDADVAWYLGRGEAWASDYDSAANNMPNSWASGSAEVNWILPDTLRPNRGSYGAFHNVVRTFKNGSLRNAQTGGQANPNDGVNKVNVDINGFATNSGRMKISVTGGAGGGNDGPGSLTAVYAMGAEFSEVSNMWLPWLPNASGLDAPVADYYASGNGGAPSISDIAAAAAQSGCLNCSSMLVDALNGATSVTGSQVTVGDVHLVCDLTGSGADTVYSSALSWWQSVQAEASADAIIPTPGAAALLTLAGACVAYPRRR